MMMMMMVMMMMMKMMMMMMISIIIIMTMTMTMMMMMMMMMMMNDDDVFTAEQVIFFHDPHLIHFSSLPGWTHKKLIEENYELQMKLSGAGAEGLLLRRHGRS